MFFDDENELDYGGDEFETIENEDNLLLDAEIENNKDMIPDNYDDNYLEINCLEEEENFIHGQLQSEVQSKEVGSNNTQNLTDLNNSNRKEDQKNNVLPKDKAPSTSFKPKDNKYRIPKKNRQYHRSFYPPNQAKKNGFNNFELNSLPFHSKSGIFNNKIGRNFKKFSYQQPVPPELRSVFNTTNQRRRYNKPLFDVLGGMQQQATFTQPGIPNGNDAFSFNPRNQLWFPQMSVPQFEGPSNNVFPHFQFSRNDFQHKKTYERNIQNRAFEHRFDENYNVDTDPEIILKNQTLEAEEKKLIELQKEARMKRFMKDFDSPEDQEKFSNPEHVKETGFRQGNTQNTPEINNTVKSRRKKKSTSEKNQKFVKNIGLELGFPKSEPNICKEILMKKKNPFTGSSDIIVTNPELSVKKDLDLENQMQKVLQLKQQILESFDVKPIPAENKEIKFLTSLTTDPAGLKVVKKDDNNVSFVRTISKTFEELSLLKNKCIPTLKNIDLHPEVTSPLKKPSVTDLRNSSGLSALKTEEESPLIGCIVKVLNVPDSTNTNDILAMCGPVGQVLEMKLNMPKENSVVIRFAQASFAEKFYNLYHGLKFNNSFLNVILV